MAGFNLGDVIVRLKADVSDLERGMTQAQSAISRTKSVIQTMAGQASTAFGNIANGIANFAKKLFLIGAVSSYGASRFINLAAELETTQQRMVALSGSTSEAKKVFGELYNYTLGKPIEFPTAAKAAKTLMGYGVQANKVVGHMKTLSAFAIVNGADMAQLALAYGQVNAKGKLMGQEVLQLTNNFVPVTRVIAEHFNVSIKKAQELIEGGKVSAQEFNAAMANFIPQDKIAAQSNTFKNRMISLQGAIRSFALELLGIHIDPKLGLVVEPGGLFDRLSNFLPKITQWLKDMKPAVAGAFQWIVDHGDTVKAILVAIAAAFIAAKLASIGFAIAAAANPFTLIAAAVVALIAALAFLQVKFNWIGRLWAIIGPPLTQLWNGFKQIASIIWTFLKPALTEMMNSIKQAWRAFQPLWQQIKGPVMSALKVLIAIIIGPTLVAIALAVAAIIGITYALAKVISWIAKAQAWFFKMVSAVITVVRTVIANFGRLPSAIGSILSRVIRLIGSLPGKILRALGNLGSLLYRAGQDLLNGLIRGITDKIGAVIEAGKNAARAAANAVKGFLRINSPSRLFMEMGQFIGEGMAVGISNSTKAVQKAAQEMSQAAAITGAQGTVNNISNNSKILGPINIANRGDADYFIRRMTRNQELSLMGLSPNGG